MPVNQPMWSVSCNVVDELEALAVNQIRRISCNGEVDFTYDSAGVGQTAVVLLHGLFGSPANWHQIMERLAHRYRFFALQLPIDPHVERKHLHFHSIGQLTDHVERFFSRLDAEQIVLCGNSLGGQIAIRDSPDIG